jgi:protein disulfide-isomerase
MNQSPIIALLLTVWLAGWAAAAFGQSPETPAPGGSPAPTAASPANPAELTWLTDLPNALVRAKAEGKSVLLFFHGSDWCPACLELQRQVLATPEFVQYARRALVLVDVDFPQKTAQSDALKRANLALKARFNLSSDASEGFPTLVLLNDAGETVFQETGYAGGGPPEILPKLQRHPGASAAPAAAAPYQNLSVAEFAARAQDKQNVILDVRTPEEFAAGHLAGAVNLDVSASDFKTKAAALDRSKTYLVHCASGGRSVRACEQLHLLDFPNLCNLPGGFRAWVKAGQPVVR